MTAGKALFVDHGAYSELGFFAEQAERRGFDVMSVRFARSDVDPRDFALITVLGSPSAAYDETIPWLRPEMTFVRKALHHNVPTVGICFGAQLLSRCMGGHVGPAARPELGWTTIDSGEPDLIHPGPWFEMHGDAFTLPPGAVELARNGGGLQAFARGHALGVQFHPEVTEEHVQRWLAGSPDFVSGAAVDPELILKETRDLIGEARRRAYALFDRIWERIGS